MSVFVIIGTLIGAGFASGQEIYIFFYKYGLNGIFGLALCSVLISIIILKTFSIIDKKDIKNYKEFLKSIVSNEKIVKIINIVIDIFLLVTFYIMVSGFGTYFSQEYFINKMIGASILAIVCYFAFMTNIDGVAKINTLVVPILSILIIIIGMLNIKNINLIQNINMKFYLDFNWLIQSIIYTSYNTILLIPVLINLKKFLKTKKQMKTIATISGIIIFVLAFIIFCLLSDIDINVDSLEMPAVYAVGKNNNILRIMYGIIILFSICSTAISIGYSFLSNIVKNKTYYPQFAAILCITSVLISNIGFSNLVKILFPFFGYLGLIQIYYILKNE